MSPRCQLLPMSYRGILQSNENFGWMCWCEVLTTATFSKVPLLPIPNVTFNGMMSCKQCAAVIIHLVIIGTENDYFFAFTLGTGWSFLFYFPVSSTNHEPYLSLRRLPPQKLEWWPIFTKNGKSRGSLTVPFMIRGWTVNPWLTMANWNIRAVTSNRLMVRIGGASKYDWSVDS